MGQRPACGFLLYGCVTVLLSSTVATAVPVARYDAAAATPAPMPDSPAGGGWSLITNLTPLPTVGPVSDAGQNAWNVNDNTGASLRYGIDLGMSEVDSLSTTGWTLSARMRFVAGDTGNVSQQIDFINGAERYLLLLDIDSAGQELTIRHFGTAVAADGMTTLTHFIDPTTVATGASALAYHDYAIIFDPDTDLVQLFIDDTLIYSDWEGQANTSRYIRWGAGSSSGRGNANWQVVDLSPPATDPPPTDDPPGGGGATVPEPASILLLAVATLAAGRRGRDVYRR